MSRPWMPLYVADYLADTSHLNAAESGAYLHLIMHYWQKGSLPNDEQLLCRIARMLPEQWDKSRAVIAEFFNDGWKHGRIDEELAKARAISGKRSNAGKQGADKRKAIAEQEQSNCQTEVDTRARVPQPQSQDTSLRSDAGVTPAVYADAKHELWGEGPRMLGEIGGIPPSQRKTLIGKWLRETGDDHAGVLDAIRRAREFKPQEPIAWITRALPSARKPSDDHRNRSVVQAADRLHDDVAAALAEPRPPTILSLADYGDRSREAPLGRLPEGRSG